MRQHTAGLPRRARSNRISWCSTRTSRPGSVRWMIFEWRTAPSSSKIKTRARRLHWRHRAVWRSKPSTVVGAAEKDACVFEGMGSGPDAPVDEARLGPRFAVDVAFSVDRYHDAFRRPA